VRLKLGVLFVCIAAIAVVLAVAQATGGGPRRSHNYVNQQVRLGGRAYRVLAYVPAHLPPAYRPPLIVVLHGCSMTAEQEALASDFAPVADRNRFIVIYPEVDAADRAYGQCWKAIWNPAAERRGHGDAAAIVAITRAAASTWRVNPSRVYVIGISAGAFESAALGANYPDVYAAIGIHSGAAYRGGAEGCLPGVLRPSTTSDAAKSALSAMGAHVRLMPVIVLHGTRDQIIPTHCGAQAVQQWLDTDKLVLQRSHHVRRSISRVLARHPATGGRRAYSVVSYFTGENCPLVQYWIIDGMRHAWAGGSTDPAVARFTDPSGPDAAAAAWNFFSHWALIRGTSSCMAHRRLPGS
jgi:poly(hydroxyalkanoate) depolymerase family esterase